MAASVYSGPFGIEPRRPKRRPEAKENASMRQRLYVIRRGARESLRFSIPIAMD